MKAFWKRTDQSSVSLSKTEVEMIMERLNKNEVEWCKGFLCAKSVGTFGASSKERQLGW